MSTKQPLAFSDDQIKTIQRTVCAGATKEEVEVFLHVCRQTGLDPLLKQIYSIKRGSQRTIQTSIDGLRLIADRTGQYSPGKENSYRYDEKGKLVSATAYVMKMTPDGTWHETASTAYMAEYNPGMGLWKKLPHVMIGKCAEANALRRAFPAEMCGIYTSDEMEQAERDQDPEKAKETAQELNKKVVTLSQEQVDRIMNEIHDEEDEAWLADVLQKANKKSLKEMPQKWYMELNKTFEAYKKQKEASHV